MSVKRSGLMASLVLMLFLLTGGYYVQVIISFKYYFFVKNNTSTCCLSITITQQVSLSLQHLPKFMRWMKYISFMYYGFRLLLKVQYSGDQVYECESRSGCKSLQSSPSFDTVNLNGSLQEVWILIAMALIYRFFAYLFLSKRINTSSLWFKIIPLLLILTIATSVISIALWKLKYEYFVFSNTLLLLK